MSAEWWSVILQAITVFAVAFAELGQGSCCSDLVD